MIKKIITISSSVLGMLAFAIVPAFAHVIVTPDTAGVASFQEFNMEVPTEKDIPTTSLTLLIPQGVKEVVPNVKAGWTIAVIKKGDAVSEIDWTGGSIPAGQRDVFLFQAQVPPSATTLQWKAYQTYADGSVVAWDHKPNANSQDDAAPPPYSTTKVINDLAGVDSQTDAGDSSNPNWSLLLSVIAFVFSVVAFGMQFRKKRD